MPEQGLRKEASAPHVWKHAVTESKSDGSVYKRVAGSAMSPEQRAALIIGRRWRARTASRSALRRSRLIERLGGDLPKLAKAASGPTVILVCGVNGAGPAASCEDGVELESELESELGPDSESGSTR